MTTNPFFTVLGILGMFVIGILLRQAHLAHPRDADFLLKLVFYVTLPALVLSSLTKVMLEQRLVILPLAALLTMSFTALLALIITSKTNLDEDAKGVIFIGSMIMNLGFNLPFVIALYGPEGVAFSALFDVGNGLLTMSVVYMLAIFHGKASQHQVPLTIRLLFSKEMIKKLLSSPPLWATMIGISSNFLGLSITFLEPVIITPLSQLTGPLILLSLGIHFQPKVTRLRLAMVIITTRMLGGFLVGMLLIITLQLQGTLAAILLASCAAPVGFNTLTFATLEALDKELAAVTVSLSISIGLVTTPMILLLA